MRCAKCFSAKFGCEYCFNCAVPYVNKKSVSLIEKKIEIQAKKINEQILQLQQNQETQLDSDEGEEIENLRQLLNSLNKEKDKQIQKQGRKQLTWPASTSHGNLRTIENITEMT